MKVITMALPTDRVHFLNPACMASTWFNDQTPSVGSCTHGHTGHAI